MASNIALMPTLVRLKMTNSATSVRILKVVYLLFMNYVLRELMRNGEPDLG